MLNIKNQPFLLSLQQEAGQTGDSEGFKTLLLEQQNSFKIYLDDCSHADISIEKRYEFLKTAEYELCHIQMMLSDKISANDAVYFRFWSNLAMDTQRYINIGIQTLEFMTTCPEHMLNEPSKTFSDYEWIAQKIDLAEVAVGLYQADVFRLINGKRPSFAKFLKSFADFFGISYVNIYHQAARVVDRKKNQTPFLLRVIAAIKSNRIKMDDESV